MVLPGVNYNYAYHLYVGYEVAGKKTEYWSQGPTITPGTNDCVVKYTNADLYSIEPVTLHFRIKAKDVAGNVLDTYLWSEPTLQYSSLVSNKDEQFGWRYQNENLDDEHYYYQGTNGSAIWLTDNRHVESKQKQRIIGISQVSAPNWYRKPYTYSTGKLGSKVEPENTTTFKVTYQGVQFNARRGVVSSEVNHAICSTSNRLLVYWDLGLTAEEFVTKALDEYFKH